jgi:hypothetical protein
MALSPRKTYPELTALSAPVVDSDVVAVYRSPGPLKRTTASVLKTYAQTGLGTMATQNANAVAITGGSISGVTGLQLANLGQFQRVLAKLDNNEQNANMVLLGDSTGDATTEWYYLLGVSLAGLYPGWNVQYRLWNDGASAYDAAVNIQTGGTNTLTLWNGSIAGSTANRHAGANFDAVVRQPNPDLVFLSYGHNGGDDALRQLSYFDGIEYRLRASVLDIPVVQIGQNPTLTGQTMAAKVEVFRALAARNGWGFIDVHAAFEQAGVPLSDLLADNVHPNAAGSALWRTTVLNVMNKSRGAYGGGDILASRLIRSWSSFIEFDTWSKTNVTLTKDTTAGQYETGGNSALATITSTASPGWINTRVLSGDDAPALAGKYVNVSVWMRVPAGNMSGSGRIDLTDSAGTTTTSGVQMGAGFILFSCTRKLDLAATYLDVYIYPADDAASPANAINIDRVSFSLGMSPVDPFAPFSLFGRDLRVSGSSSSGLAVLYNANSTSVGLKFIATETAAPATAYTTHMCADFIGVKQVADAELRYRMDVNGIFYGGGSSAATIRHALVFADTLGLNAHFAPNADATYDLGFNGGGGWNRLYLADGLYVDGVRVVREQGAAVADATDAASAITQLNALLARIRTHGLIAT